MHHGLAARHGVAGGWQAASAWTRTCSRGLGTQLERARIPRVAGTPSSFGDRSGQDPLGSSSSSSSNRSSISTKQQRERPSSSSSSNGGPGPHEQQPQQQQQQQQQQQDGPALDSLLLTALASEASDEQQAAADSKAAGAAGWAATLGVVAGISILMGGGYLFRGQIKHFLDFFIAAVDDWGVWGYAAYAAVYTALEVLAVPAVPLTMTAGAIFGPLPGTIVVSLSGTLAATIAFLIARYAARDKIAKLAYRNKRFAAVDRAISRNGLKFVTLLRLSPLLPLAASNYLYGLTSVDLGSYVLGSWLGMLPGTYAYVTAGHVGKAVFEGGEGSLGVEGWQVGLALAATALALGFVGHLAKQAVEEADQEVLQEQAAKLQQSAEGPAAPATAAAAAAAADGSDGSRQ